MLRYKCPFLSVLVSHDLTRTVCLNYTTESKKGVSHVHANVLLAKMTDRNADEKNKNLKFIWIKIVKITVTNKSIGNVIGWGTPFGEIRIRIIFPTLLLDIDIAIDVDQAINWLALYFLYSVLSSPAPFPAPSLFNPLFVYSPRSLFPWSSQWFVAELESLGWLNVACHERIEMIS